LPSNLETSFERAGGPPLAAGIALAVAVVAYAALRAGTVGFTHDESSTFLDFAQVPVYDLFFNERHFVTANNHLLNSIALAIGYRLAGAEPWALRWGSVAAAGIFAVYATRLIRLWIPVGSWRFFAAVCIVLLNHYAVDFFSLARGYGLSLAFELAALFYFFRWVNERRRYDLFKLALALSLAILANFTMLDLAAALAVGVAVAVWREKRPARGAWPSLVLAAIPLLVTAALIYRPLRWIGARGEFGWGPVAFWETWRVLIERYVHDGYLGPALVRAVFVVAGTVAAVLVGYSIVRQLRRNGLRQRPALFYASLLLLATMLATVAQHYLLGANYLSGRTAVLFYPLLSIVAVLWLLDHSARHPRTAGRWWLAAAGFAALNFLAAVNLHYVLEWRYDADTRDAVLAANAHAAGQEPVQFGAGWQFAPTAIFYRETRGLANLAPIRYNSSHDDVAWVLGQPFELIYVRPEVQEKVADQYEVIQNFPQGALMKRK
jgi:hypothetical protein